MVQFFLKKLKLKKKKSHIRSTTLKERLKLAILSIKNEILKSEK